MKLSTLLARLRPASVPHIFKESVGSFVGSAGLKKGGDSGGTAIGKVRRRQSHRQPLADAPSGRLPAAPSRPQKPRRPLWRAALLEQSSKGRPAASKLF